MVRSRRELAPPIKCTRKKLVSPGNQRKICVVFLDHTPRKRNHWKRRGARARRDIGGIDIVRAILGRLLLRRGKIQDQESEDEEKGVNHFTFMPSIVRQVGGQVCPE